MIYCITNVDHQAKCVFNGSELGKQYSAKAIQERCQLKDVSEQKLAPHSAQKPIGLQSQAGAEEAETKVHQNASQIVVSFKESESVLDTLMKAVQVRNYLPYHLKRKKKRRKRRNISNNH